MSLTILFLYSGGKQIIRNKNGASKKDSSVQCNLPISPVSMQSKQKVHRSYVPLALPLLGRHEIYVTNASTGPYKFNLRLKKDSDDFTFFQHQLDSSELVPLKQIPENGIPCLVHHSNVKK